MTSKKQELSERLLELKQSLNNLYKEREHWKTQKQSFRDTKKRFIQDLRQLKDKKKEINRKIGILKQDRESSLEKVKQASKKKRELQNSIREQAKALGLKKDITQIEEEIERLEYTIETSAITYEKEKKILKQIKQLKSLLEKASKLRKQDKMLKDIEINIREFKNKLDDQKNSVRELMEQKKQLNGNIEVTFKEIDEVSKQEVLCEAKIIGLNKEIALINKSLQTILKDLSIISKKDIKVKKITLEDVEKKLLKGEKLTTEDLLKLQRTMKT